MLTQAAISAQTSADGKTVALRVVNDSPNLPLVVSIELMGGTQLMPSTVTYSTMAWPDLKGANTPGEPTKISPTAFKPVGTETLELAPQSYTTVMLVATSL
jgi:alpha-L-arabinofuranosidase